MNREDQLLAWRRFFDDLETRAYPRDKELLESWGFETPAAFAAAGRAALEADPDEFLSTNADVLTDILWDMLGNTSDRASRFRSIIFDMADRDPRVASAMKRAKAAARRAHEIRRLRAAGKSWAAIGRDLAYAEGRQEPYSADAMRAVVRRNPGHQ
ncbi:MAG: hypothetical protein ACOYXS_11585 [Chloroflexota bacterium]